MSFWPWPPTPEEDYWMGANRARTIAIAFILLAVATLTFALAQGGDILLIILGLILAATSMELFRQAKPEREDE
jgi:hypothetical protein